MRGTCILQAAEKAKKAITIVGLQENDLEYQDVEQLVKAAVDLNILADTCRHSPPPPLLCG